MNLLKRIFGEEIQGAEISKPQLKFDSLGLTTLENFIKKNADDRLREIIILGETGDNNAFETLLYAIRNDKSSRVVMAALKRIHKFKKHNDLTPLMDELKTRDNIKEYEPYYSMALLNLGMITEEEFSKVLDYLL